MNHQHQQMCEDEGSYQQCPDFVRYMQPCRRPLSGMRCMCMRCMRNSLGHGRPEQIHGRAGYKLGQRHKKKSGIGKPGQGIVRKIDRSLATKATHIEAQRVHEFLAPPCIHRQNVTPVSRALGASERIGKAGEQKGREHKTDGSMHIDHGFFGMLLDA